MRKREVAMGGWDVGLGQLPDRITSLEDWTGAASGALHHIIPAPQVMRGSLHCGVRCGVGEDRQGETSQGAWEQEQGGGQDLGTGKRDGMAVNARNGCIWCWTVDRSRFNTVKTLLCKQSRRTHAARARKEQA